MRRMSSSAMLVWQGGVEGVRLGDAPAEDGVEADEGAGALQRRRAAGRGP